MIYKIPEYDPNEAVRYEHHDGSDTVIYKGNQYCFSSMEEAYMFINKIELNRR